MHFQDILNTDTDIALLQSKNWFQNLMNVAGVLGEVKDKFHYSSTFYTTMAAYTMNKGNPGTNLIFSWNFVKTIM